MSDTAEILVFPLTLRVALVAETIELLQRKNAAAATRFWQLTNLRLQVELAMYGVTEAAITRELDAFEHAVLRPAYGPTYGDDAA